MNFNYFLTKKNRYQGFWKWFKSESNNYYNLNNNDTSKLHKLKKELEKVNNFLTFEISTILKSGKRELIISADGIKSAFPDVIKLVEEAPELNSFKITAFRQAKPQVTEIYFGALKIPIDSIFFSHKKNKDSISLIISIRNYKESEKWNGISYIILDHIIGEYDTETIIDSIEEIELYEFDIPKLYRINELPKIIEKYKLELKNN